VPHPPHVPLGVAGDHSSRAWRDRDRLLKLAVVGTAAGLYSGIFGVGGGAVIVPLLVLWLGYTQREAVGTSLLVIAFIAAYAAALQGAYGNLRVLDGVLVGGPAVAGVLFGAWLAQRLPHRTLALLFAALLVGAAVELALQ
jgi:uncharacterized protein